jgi:hypothetical protein
VNCDMMPMGPMLAVTASRHALSAVESAGGDMTSMPTHWPMQTDVLSFCRSMGPGIAVVFILAGIVYLLFGYNIFKILVTANAALLGAIVAAVIGERADIAIPAAVVGGMIAAAAAWPTMKYSVAIMGGLFGAVLGVTIWRLSNLDPSFGWSGGMTGMVLCGLMSLLLFRECIMTYTSLQGAVMLVLGILALCFKYDSVGGSLETHLKLKPFLLPMTIFVPTLIGFIYQQTMFPPAAPQQGPPKK